MDLQLETTPCPLCRADQPTTVLSGRDLLCGVAGEFHVVRCGECRHAYLNPRPDEATIGACYPSDYGPHKTTVAVAAEPTGQIDDAMDNVEQCDKLPRPWYLSKWFRMIPGPKWLYYWLTDFRTQFVPEGKPGRALDVGCAGGDFLMTLRDAGWQAEGVELMPEPAAVAKSRGFEVADGTLEAAAFPAKRFDAVFASMVLEHLHEPRETLAEIHRVLEADGWFVFTVPNFACWERWFFGSYWRGLELPRHLQHYSPVRLQQLLDEFGFDRVNIMHQRNLNNIIATLGLWLRERSWGRRLGQSLIGFTDNPTMWWQLILAIPAKILAFIRQGGRLTVVARKAS